MLLSIAGILEAVAWFGSDIEADSRLAVAIVGASFAGLSLLTGLVALYRYRQRDQLIEEAIDGLETELSVENRRLIRRHASGREVVWPREKIEDVVAERRTETTALPKPKRRPFVATFA